MLKTSINYTGYYIDLCAKGGKINMLVNAKLLVKWASRSLLKEFWQKETVEILEWLSSASGAWGLGNVQVQGLWNSRETRIGSPKKREIFC